MIIYLPVVYECEALLKGKRKKDLYKMVEIMPFEIEVENKDHFKLIAQQTFRKENGITYFTKDHKLYKNINPEKLYNCEKFLDGITKLSHKIDTLHISEKENHIDYIYTHMLKNTISMNDNSDLFFINPEQIKTEYSNNKNIVLSRILKDMKEKLVLIKDNDELMLSTVTLTPEVTIELKNGSGNPLLNFDTINKANDFHDELYNSDNLLYNSDKIKFIENYKKIIKIPIYLVSYFIEKYNIRTDIQLSITNEFQFDIFNVEDLKTFYNNRFWENILKPLKIVFSFFEQNIYRISEQELNRVLMLRNLYNNYINEPCEFNFDKLYIELKPYIDEQYQKYYSKLTMKDGKERKQALKSVNEREEANFVLFANDVFNIVINSVNNYKIANKNPPLMMSIYSKNNIEITESNVYKYDNIIAENKLKTLAFEIKNIKGKDYLMERLYQNNFYYSKPLIRIDENNIENIRYLATQYIEESDKLLFGQYNDIKRIDDNMVLSVKSKENKLKIELIQNSKKEDIRERNLVKCKGNREVWLMPFSDCLLFNKIIVSGHSNIFDENYLGKGYGKALYDIIDSQRSFTQIPNHYERKFDFSGLSPQAKKIWEKRQELDLLPIKPGMNNNIMFAENLQNDIQSYQLTKTSSSSDIIIFIQNIKNNDIIDYSDYTKNPFQNNVLFQIDGDMNFIQSTYGSIIEKQDVINRILKIYDTVLTEDDKEYLMNDLLNHTTKERELK